MDLLLLGLLLLWSAGSLAGPTLADEPQQAGLVVQFGDNQVETYCLAFDGEQISGDELLAGSGLALIIDPSSGMGIAVCKIEGLGCNYPAERCFCQCMGGGPCAYWNYYYRDAGAENWTYSPLGAVLRQVRPGAVEAWVWGDGHTPPATDLTFAAICIPPTATPKPPTPTASPAPPGETPPPTATATASPPTAIAASLLPTPTATPAPSADSIFTLSTYWPFGLMLLALLALAAFIRLRRP